jgi:hypothetical protein
MMLVLALPAFAEIEVTNKGTDELVIGGYMVFFGGLRDNDEGTFKQNTDTFRLQNARLAVKGKLPNNFSFKLQGEFAPNSVRLRDGWLQWDNDESTFFVRGGQFKPPYSMSATTGDTALWTTMRPMVVNNLAPGRQIGMAMGGTFDTESEWTWMAGAWNGNGGWNMATDDNDPFVGGARIEYGQRDDFLIGIDAYGGAQGGGNSLTMPVRTDLFQFGAHVAVQWDDHNEDEVNEWLFEAEYLWQEMDPMGGTNDETEADGWWALLGYWFNPMWHGHIMVDHWDPDNDVDDDEFMDFTFGFSYHWTSWLDPKHEKVVFEYVHHDEAGTDFDDDEIRGLWQLTY